MILYVFAEKSRISFVFFSEKKSLGIMVLGKFNNRTDEDAKFSFIISSLLLH